MDHAKVAFGSFVPVPEARKYDAAIKQYLVALNSLSADLRAIVRKDAREILQVSSMAAAPRSVESDLGSCWTRP